MAEKPPIYVGLFLSEKGKKDLLKLVPATHPQVFADHVTLAFGRHMEQPVFYNIGEIVPIKLTTVLSDERGQCAVVDPDNMKQWLAHNQSPHITISCAAGVRPIYSNELMKNNVQNLWKTPITVLGVMDFFPRTPVLYDKLVRNRHHSYDKRPCSRCGDLEGCWEKGNYARTLIKERKLDEMTAWREAEQEFTDLLNYKEN